MQVLNDFPLSEVLWYKIGGKARYFVHATTKEEVLKALDFIDTHQPQRIFVVGQGSNLIFPDDYFDGFVLQIADGVKQAREISVQKNGSIEIFAGETVDSLIQFSMSHNLIGLEWAGGLPGTVGGGIRGNAGAFGGEMKDRFIYAEIVELFGTSFNTKKLVKDDIQFAYRNSVVKQNKHMIVISAKFQLLHANANQLEKAKEVYYDNIAYRNEKHPLDFPSCGSVFKNIREKDQVAKILEIWPEIAGDVEKKWYGKVSMGYIIKRLGFSGKQLGGAQVAEKHCNYILNRGGAKANDVVGLINEIKEKVNETFGFTPEVEAEIVS